MGTDRPRRLMYSAIFWPWLMFNIIWLSFQKKNLKQKNQEMNSPRKSMICVTIGQFVLVVLRIDIVDRYLPLGTKSSMFQLESIFQWETKPIYMQPQFNFFFFQHSVLYESIHILFPKYDMVNDFISDSTNDLWLDQWHTQNWFSLLLLVPYPKFIAHKIGQWYVWGTINYNKTNTDALDHRSYQ